MAVIAPGVGDHPVISFADNTARPPRWATALLGDCAVVESGEGGLGVVTHDAGHHALVSVTLPGAVGLRRAALESGVQAAYETLGRVLGGCEARHAVRCWNFIPGILEPLGELTHRYMAFNAGRYRAFEGWFRDRAAFDRTVPTASGVGHAGDDLVIHCLGARERGAPVENPLQVPSYRYSARYGPLPPCFARATRHHLGPGSAPVLLVGGTASIRGEESTHRDSFEAQAEATLDNLAALVAAGVGAPAGETDPTALLHRFSYVRVYHPNAEHREAVAGIARDGFGPHCDVEVLGADLCRAELLLEIEGVASLSS